MKVNCIVVGQGLAGTLVAYRLLKRGWTVCVVDPGEKQTSSRIAAGMFTPVSGKRMTMAPGADGQIKEAMTTYREMESFLGIRFLHEMNIYQAYGSVKEQNDLMCRLEDKHFASFVNDSPEPEKHVIQPFGAFEVNQSGWINTMAMLDGFRDYLMQQNALDESVFDHRLVIANADKITYKDTEADYLIFCEGYLMQHNPFFSNHQIVPCKGDVFEITCDKGPENRIVKKGCYMVKTGEHTYRVGSTYLWEETDLSPTAEGRQSLKEKLDNLIDLPYEIKSHLVGIRPTTKNRMPFIARHPEYQNIFALNGLGTKGVMHGPEWSERLVGMMEGIREGRNE